MNKQTTYATKLKDIKSQWFVIDATDKPLGRVASKAAKLLMGKENILITSNLDCGENVIIINSGKVNITGSKRTNKIYYKHTGFLGGIKSKTFEQLHAKSQTKALEIAIKGMLPKNRMGRSMITKLHIYPMSEHKHSAQQPKLIEL